MGPLQREGSSDPIDYEPASVKDLLVEMKDTSELLIDLAYSAVLQDSEAIASEVLKLEEVMNVLQVRARMSLMMSARSPADAEALAPVFSVVAAAAKISDAAADIAKIVIEEVGLPDAIRGALPEAVEVLVRTDIHDDSTLIGRTLGEINLESETGVRVIAIRRESGWLLNPGKDSKLLRGDAVLLRGPETGVVDVFRDLAQEEYSPSAVPEPTIDDLERAVDSIVLMKDLSELAVDLAYSSILFDNVELAEEVRNIEIEVDALQTRLEAWTLQAAASEEDPVALRGLIHLAISTEVISDAALQIADGVRREAEVHPVVALAVQESDEIIVRVTVKQNSQLENEDVEDGIPAVDPTMSIIAIRRPETGWMLVPSTTLKKDDVIIAKGTRTAAADFRELALAE